MPEQPTTPTDSRLTLEESQRLIHELRVHQMELAALNDELRRVHGALEASKADFVELYDQAPVGYCSVSKAGLITRINLTLTTLLGAARTALLGQPLSRFLVPQDQDLYYQLRKRLELEAGPQSCELRMLGSAGAPVWVRLDAAAPSAPSGVMLLTVVDISASKRTQAAKRINDAALKSMSTGVIVTNADRMIVSCNAAFSAITGYSEAEIVGRDCRFLQGLETDPRTLDAIRAALREHAQFDGEILNYRRDGTAFWNGLTISPVLDAHGVLTHFVGVTRDITHVVSTRMALEESLTKLRHTTEMLESTGAIAQVGGWEVHIPSMKLSWTQQTFRIAGIEPPVEPPLEEGIQLFAPEARPTVAAAVQAAIDHGTPYDLELPLIDAKGRNKWVRTQGFAEMRNGKALRIYGTFQDISQHKAEQAALEDSQTFLRAIVDAVPNMLAYWGADLKCRFANGAYRSWFGCSAAQINGMPIQVLLGDALFEKNEPFIRAALAGQDQQFERTLTKDHGETIYTLAQYISHWEDGKVVGFLALITDITEVKNAQTSLSASLQEQKALLKEVHHRVKNNLQVIASLLRLEARRTAVPESVDVLNSMQSRIQSMAQLHESLYRSGTFASVDLGAYLGRVANLVFQAHRSQAPGVRLTLNLLAVAVAATVSLELALPCGLLLNELVVNCLKHGFAEGRSGEICVDLQPTDRGTLPNGALWCLRVSDTGVGLAPGFEARRADRLGLNLVEDLSRQIGGKLHVHSRVGMGSQFSVIFPVQQIVPLVMP